MLSPCMSIQDESFFFPPGEILAGPREGPRCPPSPLGSRQRQAESVATCPCHSGPPPVMQMDRRVNTQQIVQGERKRPRVPRGWRPAEGKGPWTCLCVCLSACLPACLPVCLSVKATCPRACGCPCPPALSCLPVCLSCLPAKENTDR